MTFKSFANQAARPVTVSVGKGHVAGSDLDAWLDDGCVRGNWGRIPLQFCRDDKGAGPAQHWSGASGEFSLKPSPDGKHVDVDGYWNLDTRRTVSMTQTLQLGNGAEWDELRRNPALLAVAATAADMQAVGLRR